VGFKIFYFKTICAMANTVRSSFRGNDFFCLVQTHGVPHPGLKRAPKGNNGGAEEAFAGVWVFGGVMGF
jgi:hypothetical protein